MKIKHYKDDIIFSTHQKVEEINDQKETKTLPIEKQKLVLKLDKKARNGKSVTLVEKFVGTANDLEALSKALKSYCAVGGTVKEGHIEIQGDMIKKISEFLQKKGYQVK